MSRKGMLALVTALLSPTIAFTAAPPGVPDPEALRKAILGLHGETARERDAAEASLLALLGSEGSCTRRLTVPSDPEARRRVRRVIEALKMRRVEYRGERIQEARRSGQADLLAEYLAGPTRKEREEADWKELIELGRAAIKHGERLDSCIGPIETGFRRLTFHEAFRKGAEPGSVTDLAPTTPWGKVDHRSDHRMHPCGTLRGGCLETSGGFWTRSLVAARVAKLSGMSGSMVFVAGDLACAGDPYSGVFVVDGDLLLSKESSPTFIRSIVLIRGSIKGDGTFSRCLVIAGGDLRQGRASWYQSSVVSCGGKRKGHGYPTFQDSSLAESARVDFGPIRFFTLADAGFATDGLRVVSTDDAKPFAQAGLRKGDLVETFDNNPVADAEALRRLVRRRIAEGGPATMAVRRDGKTLSLVIRLPE